MREFVHRGADLCKLVHVKARIFVNAPHLVKAAVPFHPKCYCK